VILDTNALSAFSDGNPAIRQLISRGEGPYLPVIVLGEVRYGLLSSRNREARIAWLEALMGSWPILEVTAQTAAEYAQIRDWLRRSARPIPVNDVWISALARQHSMPILTNDNHFQGLPGVDVLTW
jgi:tRNA(fMet)-specific endonuclease VapC